MLIWSHLLKQSLIENFIFCAVIGVFELLFYAVTKSNTSNLQTKLSGS